MAAPTARTEPLVKGREALASSRWTARLSLTFQGGAGDNGLNIGRDGGAGSVDMTAGSTLTATSQVGAYLNVGQDAGSLGTVNVLGSTISLQGTGSGDAGAEIGARDGTGTLNLNGLTTLLDVNAAGFAYLNVGREGGFGVLNANAGTIIHVRRRRRQRSDRRLWRHWPGDAGRRDVEYDLCEQFRMAISIGHDGAANGTNSGTGRSDASQWRDRQLQSRRRSGIKLQRRRRGRQAFGQLYVTSGSVIDMDVTNSGAFVLRLADRLPSGATALVVIDGPGAEIRHADFIGIGYQAGDS